MSVRLTKRYLSCTSRYLTQHKIDADGLPLAPTWSVYSLFNNNNSNNTDNTESIKITDQQLDHLCQLAQLRLPPKDSKSRENLKSDMNELTQFIQHIQLEKEVFGGNTNKVKPLAHIWQESVGLELRNDDVHHYEEEKEGRELLKNAKQVYNHFYTVKGQHAEE
ncbi:unnamed protein product [Cunninghamella blakesleeana]